MVPAGPLLPRKRYLPKNLRGADEQLWNAFVAAAKARGMNVGDLWNQVVAAWLHQQETTLRRAPVRSEP